jgi:hypothetical protein
LTDELADHLFKRQDESPDEAFYSISRLVNHINDATINEITRFIGKP